MNNKDSILLSYYDSSFPFAATFRNYFVNRVAGYKFSRCYKWQFNDKGFKLDEIYKKYKMIKINSWWDGPNEKFNEAIFKNKVFDVFNKFLFIVSIYNDYITLQIVSDKEKEITEIFNFFKSIFPYVI